jgi:hypothetical protein
MGFWEWYFVGAAVNQILMPIAERRRGSPWSEAWLWIIVWPIAFMWPLVICDLITDIVDGPYVPRHRIEYR